MSEILTLRNVDKSFGPVTGVKDVSFSVSSGEIVSLLGPSGCGKTTTLRMIAGFEQPSSGDIQIAGKSAVGLKPYQRNVGLVFQHFALFPHMTIRNNIAYGLKYRGVPAGEREARVSEALKLVRLEGYEDRKPAQLSGGQQQRVALARAIITRPSIMLLDEPLSALDAKLRQSLQVELREILKSVNSSTIVVTHDQEEAMSLGDRLIVMNKGRIEQDGPPEYVYRHPETTFVADFIGRSSWLDGIVVGRREAGRAIVRISSGENIEVVSQKEKDTPVNICIRPEHITLLRCVPEKENDKNTLRAIVKNVLYLGSSTQYTLALSDEKSLMVDVMNTAANSFRAGDAVVVLFDPTDASIL